ncbi:MAG: class I SAM-dependent methyltransferase [Anaerolineae bacterium]|jgi:ubiquinone/menaquinone biosynthesis C-methylase UbiE|nr:class I SAM-dependent methyltransferase [Anaerolineae bacterium]
MNQPEMIALIRAGVRGTVWADLGAGEGHFTQALRTILGPAATIYAVDRDARALDAQTTASVTLCTDFTQPLPLPPLDGILIANALHFVRDQVSVLRDLRRYLSDDGRLILVEYDVHVPRAYLPYPITTERFMEITLAAGYHHPTVISTRRSPFTGVVMYGGMAGC